MAVQQVLEMAEESALKQLWAASEMERMCLVSVAVVTLELVLALALVALELVWGFH